MNEEDFWARIAKALARAVIHALPSHTHIVELSLRPQGVRNGRNKPVRLSVNRGMFQSLRNETHSVLERHLGKAVASATVSHQGLTFCTGPTMCKDGARGAAPTAHERIALIHEIEAFGLSPLLIDELSRIIEFHE